MEASYQTRVSLRAAGNQSPRAQPAIPEVVSTVSPQRPRVALAAFGRVTFDLEAARGVLEASQRALGSLDLDLVAVSGLLTDPQAAASFAAESAAAQADLIVCQFTTFVDARFVAALARPGGPALALWALRETAPVGSRLALNSLTGANLAGWELTRRGHPFRFAMGNPEEPELRQRIGSLANAAAQATRLRGRTVLVLGDAPDGFTFSTPSDAAGERFGCRVVRLGLGETFARAGEVPAPLWNRLATEATAGVVGLEDAPPEQVEKFARVLAVVEEEARHHEAAAVAVRCWPEFFTEFGAAACSMVSALNERGIPAACEADVLGALSMRLLSELSRGPAYLGDLAALDVERDAAVFWHCGAGAPSLADPRVGAHAGRHPNRGIGLTLEFALRPGRVTIARLGEGPGGAIRMLVGGGEALQAPQRFLGTAGTVRLDGAGPVQRRVARLIEQGWEPHYALAYGDLGTVLEDVAALAGIPVHQL